MVKKQDMASAKYSRPFFSLKFRLNFARSNVQQMQIIPFMAKGRYMIFTKKAPLNKIR